MIDQAEAHALATSWLRERMQHCPSAIVDEGTQEHPLVWVFFYNSIRYLETGINRYQLAGNGPLVVNRIDGSVHAFGSAHPPNFYVERYVATLDLST